LDVELPLRCTVNLTALRPPIAFSGSDVIDFKNILSTGNFSGV